MPGGWERFRVEKRGDIVFFVAHTGHTLQCADDNVRCENKNRGEWEQWRVHAIGGGGMGGRGGTGGGLVGMPMGGGMGGMGGGVSQTRPSLARLACPSRLIRPGIGRPSYSRVEHRARKRVAAAIRAPARAPATIVGVHLDFFGPNGGVIVLLIVVSRDTSPPAWCPVALLCGRHLLVADGCALRPDDSHPPRDDGCVSGRPAHRAGEEGSPGQEQHRLQRTY